MLLSYAHCHFSKIHIEIIREHISWIFYTAKYSNLLPGKSAVIPRFVALNVKTQKSSVEKMDNTVALTAAAVVLFLIIILLSFLRKQFASSKFLCKVH